MKKLFLSAALLALVGLFCFLGFSALKAEYDTRVEQARYEQCLSDVAAKWANDAVSLPQSSPTLLTPEKYCSVDPEDVLIQLVGGNPRPKPYDWSGFFDWMWRVLWGDGSIKPTT